MIVKVLQDKLPSVMQRVFLGETHDLQGILELFMIGCLCYTPPHLPHHQSQPTNCKK